MTLSWRVVARSALSAPEIERMYVIHRSLYADVTAATFHADLAEKDQVVLIADPEGVIWGYTTLLVYEDPQGWVLFSGDTGVDRAAWGATALQTGWLAAAMAAWREHGPLDWLLLAGGPRTYRYLPLFFREFSPHPTQDAPERTARLAQLARHRYGDRYRDGIVRLGAGGLRPEHDVVRPDDPVDGFFRARNPRWAEGDELACLTRIDPANLTRAGQRILARL